MACNSVHKKLTDGKQTLKLLLDMDQVLCDCDAHFLEEFRKKYPEKPYISLDRRGGFWMLDQYEELGLAKECVEVYSSKGFFANIPEIPGAIEAAKELQNIAGLDVFVCTSGIISYKYSLREKFKWIEEHLGKEWLARMILLKDKTMAYGHILIDDRVNITGANSNPTWEHVVFSTYHNQRSDLKGRKVLYNWTDGSWREVVADCMKKLVPNDNDII